jgi:hypothetical protein
LAEDELMEEERRVEAAPTKKTGFAATTDDDDEELKRKTVVLDGKGGKKEKKEPTYNPFDPVGSIKAAANEEQGSIFSDQIEEEEQAPSFEGGEPDFERSDAASYLPPDKIPQRVIEEDIEELQEDVEGYNDQADFFEVQTESYEEDKDQYQERAAEFKRVGQTQRAEIEGVKNKYEEDLKKFDNDLQAYNDSNFEADPQGLLFEGLMIEYERLVKEGELLQTLNEQYKTFYNANKNFLVDERGDLLENQESLTERKEELDRQKLTLDQERNRLEFQVENMEPTQIIIEGQGDVFRRDDPDRSEAYEDIFGGGSPDSELLDAQTPAEVISGVSPDLPTTEYNQEEYEDIFGGGSPDSELADSPTSSFSPRLREILEAQEFEGIMLPKKGDPEPELPVVGATPEQKILWEMWYEKNVEELTPEERISAQRRLYSELAQRGAPITGPLGPVPPPMPLSGEDIEEATKFITDYYYYKDQGQKQRALMDVEDQRYGSPELEMGAYIEPEVLQLDNNRVLYMQPDLELEEGASVPNLNLFRQPMVTNEKGELIPILEAKDELTTELTKYFLPPFMGGGAPTEIQDKYPFFDVLTTNREAYDKFIEIMLDDSVSEGEKIRVENVQDGIVVDVWEEPKPNFTEAEKQKIAALYFGSEALRVVDAALTIGFPLQFLPVLGNGIRAVRRTAKETREYNLKKGLGLIPEDGPLADWANMPEDFNLPKLSVVSEAEALIAPTRPKSPVSPPSPTFKFEELTIKTDPITGRPKVSAPDGTPLDQIEGNVAVSVPEAPPATFMTPDINPQTADNAATGLGQLFDEYQKGTPSIPRPPRPTIRPAGEEAEAEAKQKVSPPRGFFETEEQEAEQFLQEGSEMQGETDPFGTWVDPVPPTLPDYSLTDPAAPTAPKKPRTPKTPEISPVPTPEEPFIPQEPIFDTPEKPEFDPSRPPSPSEIPSQSPLQTPSPADTPFADPPAAPQTPNIPTQIPSEAGSPVNITAPTEVPQTTPTPTKTPAEAPTATPEPPPPSPKPTAVATDLDTPPFLDDPPPPIDDIPKPKKPTKKVPPLGGSTSTLLDRPKDPKETGQRWPSIIQWKQLDNSYATLDLDTGVKEITAEPIGTGVNEGYLDDSLKIIEKQRNRPKFEKTQIGNLEVIVRGPNIVDINRKLGSIDQSIQRRVRFRK